VVLFHFGWPGFSGGFVGVDIFFVISGFLITRLIVDEHESAGRFRFGNFYLRRVRRLFPALACTLIFSAAAAVLILSPEHLKRFSREMMVAVLSVSNLFFYSETGYFDTAKEYQALLHTWSLSVEEQFYLVWPLLLVIAMRRRMLPVVLVLIGLSSLVLAELVTDRSAAFFLTPFRAFEFAIGAALVWAIKFQPKSFALREGVVLLGLAMMGWAIHVFTPETRLPGLLMLVPTLGAALVIHAGQSSVAGLVIRNPVCVWIGKISYSLYLVHWPLVVFHGYMVAEPLSWTDRIGLVCVSVLLAAAMHYLVEQPFRAMHPTWSRNRGFIRGVGATGLVCVLFGLAVVVGEGWRWRLPTDTAKLLASAHRRIELQDECQYAGPQITADLQAKFENCIAKRGNAVLVFGDSHASDLFNALAHNGERLHVIGITEGGCRPSQPKAECYYDELPAFIAANKDNLDGLVFTQKGSYLLAGYSDLPVDRKGIDRIISYLSELTRFGIPTLWIGPQWEPYYEIDKFVALSRPTARPDYLRDDVVHIADVDVAIASAVASRNPAFDYRSKTAILGPLTPNLFIVDDEYTYSDTDHWSAKGEELFGAQLISADQKIRSLFGIRKDDVAQRSR
jgi:peptidoglycan/LPS O-acetylase OafA/YrhL